VSHVAKVKWNVRKGRPRHCERKRSDPELRVRLWIVSTYAQLRSGGRGRRVALRNDDAGVTG
jgi:hypothetical protein